MPTLMASGRSDASRNEQEHRVPKGPIDWSALAAWLRRRIEWPGGTHLDEVDVNRVWARRGGRIAFELTLTLARSDMTSTVLLQGGMDETNHPWRSHTRARIVGQSLRGIRLYDPSLGIWVCTPDRDPKLRIARRLLYATALAPWLQASGVSAAAGLVLARAAESGRLTVDLVAYRARKRCVMRVRPIDGTNTTGVFLKVFRRPPSGEQISRLRGLATQLEADSSGAVRMPPVVAFLPKEGLLATMEVPQSGGPLGDSSADSTSAALALSTLHRADPQAVSRRHTPADELQTVSRWLETLPRVCQGDVCSLKSIADDLGRRAAALGDPLITAIHRDYYAAQLLRVGDTIWLVDFDTLCLGHAELDVSTYMAHLVLDGLRREPAQAEMAGSAARFLRDYQTNGGQVDTMRLGFYLSAALARLGALHLARGAPTGIVRQMWRLADRAAHIVAGVGGDPSSWLTRVAEESV